MASKGMNWGNYNRNANLSKPEHARFGLVTHRQMELLVKLGMTRVEASALNINQASKEIARRLEGKKSE